MPLIPDTLIDEVQSRADIAEWIGRYVPLKRAGRHFKALCPFHREKTPSFMVNPEKQIFHCFGCGAGGNVFSFLVQHDRLTFPEAVRQIADHVGVAIPDRQAGASNGSFERLRALMEKICGYFERTLAHPQQGKAARAYLEQRGVTRETRSLFRLGVAPAGWDHLLKAASTTGVSVQDLEAAGLILQGRSGAHDRFRNRLIFPIQDVRGRVVGFGGRALPPGAAFPSPPRAEHGAPGSVSRSPHGQEPKYLNSPETPLYTKGRHLFGLAQAKDAIVAQKTAVIVEGYFDCVVLSGGGLRNVVSPLGTALTTDQARLLKRYAEHVILAFDADAAGDTATLRSMDLLVETGVHVHVAQLPRGMDPDEYLRLHGRDGLERLLAERLTLFEFLIETAHRRYPLSRARNPEAQVAAASFMLPTIAKVPNAILRQEYVRLLAEGLHLDEAAIAHELSRTRARSEAPPQAQASPGPRGPEQLLTALVVDEPSRWSQIRDRVSLEDVTDPTLRRILGIVAELEAGRQPATPSQVVSRASAQGDGATVTALVTLAQSVSSKEDALNDCLRRVQTSARTRRLEQLREHIRTAQEAGQERDMRTLLTEYQRVVKGG